MSKKKITRKYLTLLVVIIFFIIHATGSDLVRVDRCIQILQTNSTYTLMIK